MLANFLGVLPILTPPLCALTFIMCSKSNPIAVQSHFLTWRLYRLSVLLTHAALQNDPVQNDIQLGENWLKWALV
jgi:hypothetical protein